MYKKGLCCLIAFLFLTLGIVGCKCADGSEADNVGGVAGEDSTGDGVGETMPALTYYTVTFLQDGQEPVERRVAEGTALTDIPLPKEKTGYTVVWEEADLTNIMRNIMVRAVETANTYTVTYRLNYNYASMDKREEQVTYGETFTLETPTVTETGEYTFVKWVDETTREEIKSGVYLYPRDITVIGVWSDGHSNFY
ncbi:MAG: InlB B-repeat-containing protein [Clostridia bacterium]|nr:InlB B-repeat-containing protein [Clostridia bacterium]